MKSINSSSSSASPFQMYSWRNTHTRKSPRVCSNGLHKLSALLAHLTETLLLLANCMEYKALSHTAESTTPKSSMKNASTRFLMLSPNCLLPCTTNTTFQSMPKATPPSGSQLHSLTRASCPAHPLASTALPCSLLLSHPLSLPASSFHSLLVVVSSFSCFNITSVSNLIKRFAKQGGVKMYVCFGPHCQHLCVKRCPWVMSVATSSNCVYFQLLSLTSQRKNLESSLQEKTVM